MSVKLQTSSFTQRCRTFLAAILILCAGGCAINRELPTVFQNARTLDMRTLPPHQDTWDAFRHPSKFNTTGLYLLEPWQPGRIPLVLIHGLASDACTWEEMIVALEQDPQVRSAYQIWVFQYPTGNSYLQAAADLRRELLAVRARLDPGQQDPAFDQMVLVGHSMGGLVAQLQVSYSDDRLWQAVSDVPLDAARSSGSIPLEAEEALIFEPVPFVSQVVYIATPLRGSNWTQHPLGKFGRWLIEIPEQLQAEYVNLIHGNPGLFRNPAERLPTSIDHLAPDNDLLMAIGHLRKNDQVASYSIIGTGHRLPDRSMGDGIVAETSARIPGTRSECFIKTTHTGILRNQVAISELIRILSVASYETHSYVL